MQKFTWQTSSRNKKTTGKTFSDIMEWITEQLDVLKNVITCDEMWIFQYDLEIKRRSTCWKTQLHRECKKAWMIKSNVKAMMIIFFNIRGVIFIEWVRGGQMANQKYYLEVLTKLWERVKKRRPELWKKKSWILYQGNVPAHSTLVMKQFLADKCIIVLQHPLYLPDLGPCDFYLINKV
jgi:hypothetical protein